MLIFSLLREHRETTRSATLLDALLPDPDASGQPLMPDGDGDTSLD
jgi:hypothetical protein